MNRFQAMGSELSRFQLGWILQMDENSTDSASRQTGSSEIYGPTVGGYSSRTSSPSHGAFERNSGGAVSREISFAFLFRTALRHWRTMLLLVILGVLGGMIYIQSATRAYEAKAVVEMNVRRPRVINDAAVYEDPGMGRDADAIFNTRFEKFRSPAMEQLAIREFFKRFPESPSPDNPTSIGKFSLPSLIRDVSWRKDPSANIVRVSFRSPHPRFAANLVNVLSDCAGILMREENQAQSDEAVEWLMSQVEEQRESLEDFETQLANIREDVQLEAMQQRKETLGQAVISVSEERESLISRLAERRTVYDFVSELQKVDPNLEILPTGLPKEEQFNEMIRAWRVAYEEFQQMAGRYTTLHPEYRLAEEREMRSRNRLEQFIESSATAVQNEMDLLNRQIEQIDDRIGKMKKEASILEQSLVAGMQRVQGLERKRDAADNAFQNMLQRMEEARAAADENMAFTKVIRYAAVPRIPIKPRKPMVMIISIMVAGALGLMVTVVMELWMDKVESVSDIRSMNLNILGIIPTQKKMDSRSELATIGLRDKFSPLLEVFTGINALLVSGKYRDHSRALLMCSIMPGEGKTISACNMAISAALNGAKTLLIEGDLRRPQLARIFAVDSEHPSLLDWLHRNEDALGVEDLICRNMVENLDVIISRPCEDVNPAKLLGRGDLGNLLNWARERYDRIIIDSPPLEPVSDAQVWGNYADSLVIVTRLGKAKRRALRFAMSRFEDSGLLLLGCIANDVPHGLEGMFRGAYGYGYSNSNDYSQYHKAD